MGLVRARDDEKARGIAVEPMDDAGPLRLLAARDRVAEEAMDKRAARVSRGRVDDDPGRLVDDEQVLVFISDAEVEVLGLELRLAPLGEGELETLSLGQPVALRPGGAVH